MSSNTPGLLSCLKIAATATATVGALALTGAASAQAATSSVTNGGPVASVNVPSNALRMVSSVGARPCGGLRTTSAPNGGPVVTGSLLSSSNVAWGTPSGTLSFRVHCPTSAGYVGQPLIDCAATAPNFAVSGASVTDPSGVARTPGAANVQCNVSYVLSAVPLVTTPTVTTIAGTVPVSYQNAFGAGGARVGVLLSGQALTVTGPSYAEFVSGSSAKIGAPVGGPTGLSDQWLSLSGTPATQPVVASS